MKLLFAHLFMLVCLRSPAATVELVWDDTNNAPGSVQCYGVWVKPPGSTGFTQTASAQAKEYRLSSLGPGEWQVYVTAVCVTNGVSVHSDPSNITVFYVPSTPAPRAPANLRLKLALWTSDDMVNWNLIALQYDPAERRKFYQLRFEQ